jgi:CheY-like chemotaxis protein
MDIQLPIMDGYEATRRLKADPSSSSIPIIAVTSYALSGDEEKARAAAVTISSPSLTARGSFWQRYVNTFRSVKLP